MSQSNEPTVIDQVMPGIVARALRALQQGGEIKTFQPLVLPHDVLTATYIVDELRAAGFEVVRSQSNEPTIPPFWCEVAPGVLTLATVMPDKTVRHVAMEVGAFPTDPADAPAWIETVGRNLGVCAVNLFGEQIHAAIMARHTFELADLGIPV